MNYLNSIFRSPISVKILILIYIYSLYGHASQLLRPEVASKLGYTSMLIPLATSVIFIALIFFRVWWSWIAGVCDSLYDAIASVHILSMGNKVLSHAMESANNSNESSKLTPEQLKVAMNVGLYGGLALVIVGAIITIFLWYRSRRYFEADNRRP